MNKKTLFLILLGVLAPTAFVSASIATMAASVEATAISIAIPIIIIGWVVAGILYLTSAGSPEKTGTAKKAMIACVIGTVLVVLAIGSGAIMSVICEAFGITCPT